MIEPGNATPSDRIPIVLKLIPKVFTDNKSAHTFSVKLTGHNSSKYST